MAPYFLLHYRPICDRIVVFDHSSTDDSPEIYRRGGAEVRTFSLPAGTLTACDTVTDIMTGAWRESIGVADWVLVGAPDEHWYMPHENFLDYLKRQANLGVTAIRSLGYQMIAEKFESFGNPLTTEVSEGAFDKMYSKPSLFRTDAFSDIIFDPGWHDAEFEPIANFAKDRPYLLHYRYLGRDRNWTRFCELKTKLLPGDKELQWGIQYCDERAAYDKSFNNFLRNRVRLF